MADKTRTIKNATDQELVDLIHRLERERRLQDIIRDMKRRSTDPTYMNSDDRERNSIVSTEEPIESLYHFGVKGMKWGVRKDRSAGLIARKKKQYGLTTDNKKKYQEKKTTPKKGKTSTKNISDDELQKRVKRLQLEQQYNTLSKQDISKGRAVANKVLKTGTGLATVTTTGLTLYKNAEKIKKIITR